MVLLQVTIAISDSAAKAATAAGAPPPHMSLFDLILSGGWIMVPLGILSVLAIYFIIDYVRLMPGIPKAKVKARIVLTPQHAKRFIRALADNVKKYEQQFGVIEDNENIPYPMGFGPPAQA